VHREREKGKGKESNLIFFGLVIKTHERERKNREKIKFFVIFFQKKLISSCSPPGRFYYLLCTKELVFATYCGANESVTSHPLFLLTSR
jgi:hypothetical protein